MIIYFAGRNMNVLGMSSTDLPNSSHIIDDNSKREVSNGSATLNVTITYTDDTQVKVKEMAEAGNYILMDDDGDQCFYTIIDETVNTDEKTIDIYAEDAGMDLLNNVAGPYAATGLQPIGFYFEYFLGREGYVIGINELGTDRKLQLSWDGEETISARLLDICKQFGAELSYSFSIDSLTVNKKIVNIYKKRGSDIQTTIRMGREVQNIKIKKSVAKLATALKVTGGTDDNGNTTTLSGYSYDDGDIYVDGVLLKSRKAVAKWNRFIDNQSLNTASNHMVRSFSYDTLSKAELCDKAIEELKKLYDVEVNYEVSLLWLPKNVKVGDRINIVDQNGKLYLSSRVLTVEKSVTRDQYTATLGEFLIKDSGISDKVLSLAEEFSTFVDTHPLFTWIVYADDEEGTGITLDPSGKEYMGVAYNREKTLPDLTDPTIYSWSLIRGAKGDDGFDGSLIAVTAYDPVVDESVDPPTYTFQRLYFPEEYRNNIKAGDIVFAGDYRYVVQSAVGNNIVCVQRAALKGRDGISAVTMRIDSSRGNLFKNNNINTVLSVNLFYEGQHITTSTQLHNILGSSAYLEWKWKERDETTWHTVISSDSRLSDEGFQFRISAEDFDEKIVLNCDLNYTF